MKLVYKNDHLTFISTLKLFAIFGIGFGLVTSILSLGWIFYTSSTYPLEGDIAAMDYAGAFIGGTLSAFLTSILIAITGYPMYLLYIKYLCKDDRF